MSLRGSVVAVAWLTLLVCAPPAASQGQGQPYERARLTWGVSNDGDAELSLTVVDGPTQDANRATPNAPFGIPNAALVTDPQGGFVFQESAPTQRTFHFLVCYERGFPGISTGPPMASAELRLTGPPGSSDTRVFRRTLSEGDGFVSGSSPPGQPSWVASPEFTCNFVPQPTLGSLVVAEPTDEVRVRLPDGDEFAPLTDTEQIPVGSEVDARKGSVALTTARTADGRKTQVGGFSGSVFTLHQAASADSETELRITEANDHETRCPARRVDAAFHRRHVRLRSHSPRGFRVRGRRSRSKAANPSRLVDSVWDTVESCAGTLTRVFNGRVEVRDLGLRRTVKLERRQSYLARARVRR